MLIARALSSTCCRVFWTDLPFPAHAFTQCMGSPLPWVWLTRQFWSSLPGSALRAGSQMQVKNARGEWILAAPIPGTFVCNIGDMMRVYTNGAYTPTLHRVVNADPGRSRVSVPFFYETAFDARVAPIAALLRGDEQPVFDPVIYGRHLESKVLSNFELDGCASAAAV